MARMTNQAIDTALLGTPWRRYVGQLRVHYATGDFATAVEFVRRVGAAADAANHHPDIDLRYGYVAIGLVSHDVHAITERDVALAQVIADIAAELELTPADGSPLVLEIAVDALDIAAVRPFWKAAFAYVDARTEDPPNLLTDPRGRGPDVWFQQMDAPRPQRNRLHMDVTVAPAEAGPRIAAATAAGGRVIDDRHAPSFWVLADAEGNEVCICTEEGRDG